MIGTMLAHKHLCLACVEVYPQRRAVLHSEREHFEDSLVREKKVAVVNDELHEGGHKQSFKKFATRWIKSSSGKVGPGFRVVEVEYHDNLVITIEYVQGGAIDPLMSDGYASIGSLKLLYRLRSEKGWILKRKIISLLRRSSHFLH